MAQHKSFTQATLTIFPSDTHTHIMEDGHWIWGGGVKDIQLLESTALI